MAFSAGQGCGEANDGKAARSPEVHSPGSLATAGCDDPDEHPPEGKTPTGVLDIRAVPLSGLVEAYALCRLLYDDDGAACDWVFVDVNQAFWDLLGIPDPTGRRITEVSPGINETAPDILASCADVVASGRPQRAERRSPRSGKWLDVRLASLGSDHFLAIFEDISERKGAEEALRVTQTTVDWAPDLVQWIDTEGRVIYANEANSRLLGYTRDELERMHIWELDPNMSPERFRADWQKTAAGGRGLKETVLRDKAGRDHPVEVSSVAVEIGDRYFGIAFIRDISERKHLEETLRLTHYSVENATDLIHWVDIEGGIAFANETARRYNGYTLEEIQKLHIWDIDANMTEDLWPAAWEEVGGEGAHTIETVGARRDGSRFPVEVSSRRIEFEGTEYAVSFSRDITERMLAEKSLRDSESRYRHLFELEADAHMLVDDEDYSIIEANEAAVTLYGYSREELLDMTFLQLSNDPELSKRIIKDDVVDVPLRWHRKKDGTVFPVEGRSRRFDWQGPPVHVVAIRDITERRRTEESLLLTRHAVQQADDLMYWLDEDGRFLFVNPSTCKLLGYSVQEMLQLHIWDIVPGGELEPFRVRWNSIAEQGSGLEEDVFVGKDGRTHEVEISSNIFEYQGTRYGISSAREIEDRKRAEQSLRDSEERYRQLFELESDALVLAEDDTRQIIEVNQAAVSLYGHSRAELLTMKDSELFADPDEAQPSGKDGTVNAVLRYHRRKDGTVFPVEARVRHFEWKGQPVHVAAIRDITERKRNETELEESRRMLRQVLDTVPLRISWRDRDLRYLGCNTAVALDARLPDTSAIVGMRDEDLPWGRASAQTCADDLDIMATGVPRLAYEETMSSGTIARIMRTSKVPLRDTSEEVIGMLSVHEDVTDRVRTLEVLREREEQLRQAQKMEAVGRLAGGIAHDFNNVLTTIIGYSDLLLSTEEHEPQSLREDLTEIKAAAERAGNLTRQILAFSRRQALQPQVLLLNTVIGQTERLLTRTMGADIELKTDLSPELGLVEVDEHQFVQILLNLAVNARDAMPNGGTLLLTTKNVDLDEAFCRTHADCQPGKHVLVSVSDTGYGMDADTAAHVFEPFYTTKAPGQGTGLGLSTVYGVVAQSGGTITLESRPGHGTTFEIYLPRFDHPALESEGQALETAAASDRPTVLVVNDDATFRALITRLLEKRGYRVIPVGDGDRAVEILKNPNNRVDVLLSDVVLPGSLQGGQIGQVAKSLRPRLPVLYMSAYTRNTMVQAGRIEGSAEFLEKPFTAESLANAVKRLLETS